LAAPPEGTLIGFDDLPADIVVSDINAKSVECILFFSDGSEKYYLGCSNQIDTNFYFVYNDRN